MGEYVEATVSVRPSTTKSCASLVMTSYGNPRASMAARKAATLMMGTTLEGGGGTVEDEAGVAVGRQGHAEHTGKSCGQHVRVAVLGEGEAGKTCAGEDCVGLAVRWSACAGAGRAECAWAKVTHGAGQWARAEASRTGVTRADGRGGGVKSRGIGCGRARRGRGRVEGRWGGARPAPKPRGTRLPQEGPNTHTL